MAIGFLKDKRMGDLGMLLGGAATLAGGPLAAMVLPALFRSYQEDQGDVDEAEKLKRQRNILLSGEMPQDDGDITWNQTRPASEREMMGAANQVIPGEMMKQRVAQMFPQGDEYGQPVAGEDAEGNAAFGQYGKGGGFMGPQGFRPAAARPDQGGLVRLVGPRGQVVTVNEKSPGAQRMIADGWNKEGAAGPSAPSGYRFTKDGSLEAIPGGPAGGSNQQPAPSGYRYSADGAALEPIPGGPAEIGQKGLPQKFKDQTGALDQMENTLKEYETLLNDVGTEYWNSEKAAQLDSLQTQMMFGLKGVEQTGALDKGSVDVMAGMIPDATGFLANADPFVRGGGRAKAKLGEMKKYVTRARGSINSAYKGDAGGQQRAASAPPGAQAALRSNPMLREQYEQKYGPGSAAQVLGR